MKPTLPNNHWKRLNLAPWCELTVGPASRGDEAINPGPGPTAEAFAHDDLRRSIALDHDGLGCQQDFSLRTPRNHGRPSPMPLNQLPGAQMLGEPTYVARLGNPAVRQRLNRAPMATNGPVKPLPSVCPSVPSKRTTWVRLSVCELTYALELADPDQREPRIVNLSYSTVAGMPSAASPLDTRQP